MFFFSDVQTECDEIVYGDITYKPTPPAELRFYEEISPQHEGVPFSVQPKIRAFDKDVRVFLLKVFYMCGGCRLFYLISVYHTNLFKEMSNLSLVKTKRY
jgi:hypothetical protein